MPRILIPLLLLLLTACATTRPYARLADAGATYATASSKLLTQAGRTRVDATSERLLQLDEIDNVDTKSYNELTELDTERLEILARLRTHAQLTAQYFSRLQQLAAPKASADVAASTSALTASLNAIGKDLRGSALFKNQTIPGLVAGKLIDIKAKGLLKRELDQHATLIREELATQELLLEALRQDIQHDLKLIAQARERRTVIAPLTSTTPIANPDEWVAVRQSIVAGSTLPEELAAAATAARELRAAFEALAGGAQLP